MQISDDFSRALSRREFLLRTTIGMGAAAFVSSLAGSAAAELARPLEIGLGPQLFLDDYLLESSAGLKREVQPPQRFGKPILDNKTFGTTQPYVTVVRDEEKKRFRIWYNNQYAVWHAESEDGIQWTDPKNVWKCSHCYGCSLVDDRERATDAQRRFKMLSWQATRGKENKPGDDSGIWVGFSPDGLQWSGHDKNPVLPSWPEGLGKYVRHAAQDVVDVYYDPLQQRYGAAMKIPAVAADGYAPGPRVGDSIRRLVGMSTSKDFVHWAKPQRILAPDEKDDGLLEFYGMGGIHLRGGLYIGLVRVLRDDLSCDPGGAKDGIGYTVLATSRDGTTWQRYREPFLDRNPEPGSWDHAMTWMSYALPMNDEVFFYYGGYARGHKIEPATERQIGLARMKKDRYVAFVPRQESGTLLTRPLVVPNGTLTINANAAHGDVRVRLLDEDGTPLEALGESEAKPITGDVLAGEVHWSKALSSLRGKPVRLEFGVRNSALFGFEFHSVSG